MMLTASTMVKDSMNALSKLSLYPDLDLSQIAIDGTVPPTPGGDDTVSEEPKDFAHTVEQESKHDGVVIAQPVPKGHVAPAVLSVVDSSIADSFAKGGQSIMNPTASDVPPS